MGEEVSSLTHLRREIEDQELEVMEALEPLDEELAGLAASTAEAAEELALAREQLGMATAEIDREAARSAQPGTGPRRGSRPSSPPPTSD